MYYESHVTVLWKLPPDIDGVHFRRTFQFPNLLKSSARKAVEEITASATIQRLVLKESLTLSHQDNAIVSISASPTKSAVFPQRVQSATPDNAIPSMSASPTNSATFVPQVSPQGTEYMAILELSSTPSGPLTWEHRMKDWGSNAYEGLKMEIQGIYDFSGSFSPLHTKAGALLTISKVVDVRGFCTLRVNALTFHLHNREFQRIGRILNSSG